MPLAMPAEIDPAVAAERNLTDEAMEIVSVGDIMLGGLAGARERNNFV